jgi:hypothetical protein
MKLVSSTMVVALFLAWPQAAFALGMETFGNAPATKQPEWAEGVVDVVNLKSRVYSYWVNGNESFFYRGDARALHDALRQYAAVRDDVRQLILLPGSGKTQSFAGQVVPFDWQFHVPSGIYRAMTKQKHAVLTVYVSAPKPRPRDKPQVEKWLQDLNSDLFKTRETATEELRKLGNDAKPFLRAALKGSLTLETRRRMEALLEKLRGFDVTDLDVPIVDDLLANALKELKDPDREVRARAIQELESLTPYSDKVVPALVEIFKQDKDAHVRRMAAACLASACVQARSAIAFVKQGVNDPDKYVRSVFRDALEQIEKTKDTDGQAERIRQELAILQEIKEFKKSAGGH